MLRKNRLEMKFPTSILSSWLMTKFFNFSFSNFSIEMKPQKIKPFKTKILWLESSQLCGGCFFLFLKFHFILTFWICSKLHQQNVFGIKSESLIMLHPINSFFCFISSFLWLIGKTSFFWKLRKVVKSKILRKNLIF